MVDPAGVTGGGLQAGVLRRMLEAHGFPAERFRPILTGKFNESFYVSLADGREAVLRVAPPDDAGFLFYERRMMAQEPGLHALLREKTGIPVAEVYLYDDTRRFIGRDFILMERLPGQAMSERMLAAPAVERAFEEVGRHLRQLHEECRAERYGYLGEHRPMEPAREWVEAFRRMWFLLVEDIRRAGQYDAEEAKAVGEALLPYQRYFDREVPASLLHMDIWAQNILVDAEGRVTGIVDWDRALWGDVEMEFAVLDYCGVSTEAFWRGYGREREGGLAARVRWLFYYLYELQKYIVIRALRSRRPEEAARYKRRALELLRRLP